MKIKDLIIIYTYGKIYHQRQEQMARYTLLREGGWKI